MPDDAAPRRRKGAWRPWLRAFHRDIGYVAVGLTVVYALSGLAVNHIKDWDPNFHTYETTTNLGRPLEGDDDGIARQASAARGIEETPREVYRAADDQLDVVFEHRTLHVNPGAGVIVEEGQKPRLLLRTANWLHLNRGKQAWTYVADGYAVALLFLACSGMFMLPGRKGLLGRGALLVGLGIAIPVVYVTLAR